MAYLNADPPDPVRVPFTGNNPPVSGDPIRALFAIDELVAAIFWWMAGQESVLYGATLQLVGFTLNWLWWCVWNGMAALLSIANQLTSAFVHYWDDVLLPIWSKLWSVLAEHADLITDAWSVGLSGVQYLARDVVRSVVNWLGGLCSPLVSLVGALQNGGQQAGMAGSFVDQVVYALGQRAWSALDAARTWINLSAAWQSFYFHEQAVVREDPFVWSLTCFIGDLQSVLMMGTSYSTDELTTRLAALADAWPARTLTDWLQRFGQGGGADRPELGAELDLFRSGQ